jgi:hypothetical protein
MFEIMPYFNVDNDLSYSVDKMNLIINFTHFKSELYPEVLNSNTISIPFNADSKYAKNISIYLLKNGRIVIDEPFEDCFYMPSSINEVIDKICWFTIPANYSDEAGLNNIIIYAKGGVQVGN